MPEVAVAVAGALILIGGCGVLTGFQTPGAAIGAKIRLLLRIDAMRRIALYIGRGARKQEPG